MGTDSDYQYKLGRARGEMPLGWTARVRNPAASFRCADGFTLIEVLFALVILAVGLLSLQALSVGAVRSLGLAERNTDVATTTTAVMESALDTLRKDLLPPQFCRTLSDGSIVSRQVVVNANNPQLVRVTITATPQSRGLATTPLVTTAYEFAPDPYPTTVPGTPCS